MTPSGTWTNPKTGVVQTAASRIAELEAEVKHLKAEIRFLVTGVER